MIAPNLPLVEPSATSTADLVFSKPLDLSFEGFGPEAFAILERLREHPHIEQYREEKVGIQRHIQAPFKRYRDDLVVNWVLPNRLDFETEKNVFARILKNDFGAGGSHHHLWMSFYRPGRRRLTDVQLSHGISPAGFTVGLFAGAYAKEVFREAKERIGAEPERFLGLVNALLEKGTWRFSAYSGAGKSRAQDVSDTPLTALPERIGKAQGLWLRTVLPRDRVLAWEGELVAHALEKVRDLWPIYRFIAAR